MADSVTIDIKGNDANLNAALDRSGQSVQSFGSGVKKALATIGVVLLAKAFVNFGKRVLSFGRRMLDLFIEQEQSEARLAAVIKATGQAAGFTAAQMFDMAAAMQNATVFGDELVMKAQAILASFKNIRGDVFKDALMSAADLSALLGTDLTSSVMQVGKALNDPIKGVSMLTRVGIAFTDQQKEQIKVMQEAGDVVSAQRVILAELEGQVKGTAEAMANTFGGRLQQLKNRLGDVGEKIGQSLVPAIEVLQPIVEKGVLALEKLAPVVQAIGTAAAAGLRGLITTLRPVFDWLVDKAIWAFSAVQTAVENWQDVLWLAEVNVKLIMLKISENIKHIMGVQVPEYLSFLQNEWKKSWLGMDADLKTVLLNMGANLKTFMEATLRLLAGDVSGFLDLTEPLLDSAEATIGALPEIAARVIGEEEAGLAEMAQLIGKGLSENVGKGFERNKEKMRAMLADAAGLDLDDIVGAPSMDFGFKRERDAEAFKAEAEKTGGGRMGGFEGLLALNRRISEAAAGGGENRLVALTEEQLAMEKLQVDMLKEQAADDKKKEEQRQADQKMTLDALHLAGSLV
jgi:hypothetical protein